METTLGSLQIGSSFWFGNVLFIKQYVGEPLYVRSPESFCCCEIGDTNMYVYISDAAWVKTDVITYTISKIKS